MESNVSKWQSLKTKVILYTLAIFAAAFLALGSYITLILRDQLQSLLGEQQMSTANFIAADINNYLTNRLAALELVATKIAPFLHGNNADLQATLEQQYPLFLSEFRGGVLTTRIDGTAIAAVPRSSGKTGVSYRTTDYISVAIGEGKATISQSVTGKYLRGPDISMAVPIRNRQGKVIGAIAGVTNLAESNFLQEIFEGRYGKTGGYMLITSRQRLILAASKTAQIPEKLPPAGINPLLDRFIHGQENPAIFFNQRGVQMLGSSVRIPLTGWVLAVMLPMEEAFAPVRSASQAWMSGAIMLTLLATGMTWLLLRQQLSPIIDATKMMDTVAEANWPVQALPVSGGDEINTLFASFNRLLKGLWRREQHMETRIQEINSAKERAEDSDRIKSAFLSNMVHDIRTPMNSIVGFAQLMSATDVPEKERAEYSEIINRSSSRLFKTINNILDLSRIETGQAVVKKKAFNIYRLLQDLQLAHLDAFKQKKIDLKIEVSPRLESLVILSDEQKVYRVLDGLLDNACKFTEKGHVEFGFELIEKQLLFFVKDTGIGIPKKKQEIIFSKFYQMTMADKKGEQVTGLDLVLSKGLITLMGGRIWFESEEGVGSHFKFTIPFETPPASTLARTVETEKAPGEAEMPQNLDWSKKTILVAEDDMNNYLLLRTILTNRTQVVILHAGNGLEALEILKNNPAIDVILMDLKMPGMDGFTATRKIREFNKRLPIYAVTAYSEPEDRKKALEAGCNDFITKPFETESILRTLAKTLEK